MRSGFTTIGVLGMVGRAEDPLGLLRAMDAALDAVESALERRPWIDHRHRWEHNALITGEQLRRAKSLGVELSFFTEHLFYYGDRLPEIVGSRVERYIPVGTAFREGHRATIHNDNPMTRWGRSAS